MQGHERISKLHGFPTSLQLAQQTIDKSRQRLRELQARHAMASQIPALLSHPGFKTFLEKIGDLRDRALQDLMQGSADHATMMGNRERAAAYDSILTIVQDHENLAGQLAELIESEQRNLST